MGGGGGCVCVCVCVCVCGHEHERVCVCVSILTFLRCFSLYLDPSIMIATRARITMNLITQSVCFIHNTANTC